MDLYFMRHGETPWNREGRIQGATDIDLTDFGRELAAVTASGFAAEGVVFDRIYASPLRRAVETAKIIAERTLIGGISDENFIIEPHIVEMNFGGYEGQVLREVRRTDKNIDNCFAAPSLYVPDARGEGYGEVQKRVAYFIDEVVKPLEGSVRRVLAVCHGTVVRAFLARLRGLALDDYWTISQPNCCVNRAVLKDGEFSMVEEKKLYYDPEIMKNRGIL